MRTDREFGCRVFFNSGPPSTLSFCKVPHQNWVMWLGQLALSPCEWMNPPSSRLATRFLTQQQSSFVTTDHNCHFILVFSCDEIDQVVALLVLHELLISVSFHPLRSNHSFLSHPFVFLLPPPRDSLRTCVQEAIWLLFCSGSFLSSSSSSSSCSCSCSSVLSLTALSRILSSVFSFSRFSEVSASSCRRLTAFPSSWLFSWCCSSRLCLSRCSSAFWDSKPRLSNVRCRLSRHSCASCWDRRSRAWCSVWTSRCSARNSARRTAAGPEPSAFTEEATGLSASCAEPECCRTKWRRLGNVMGRSSGNFTLRCFLKEKKKLKLYTLSLCFSF